MSDATIACIAALWVMVVVGLFACGLLLLLEGPKPHGR